jgi:hypothetical protein
MGAYLLYGFLVFFIFQHPSLSSSIPETATTTFTSLDAWVNYTISPVVCSLRDKTAPENINITFTVEQYKLSSQNIYWAVFMNYKTNTSYRSYPLSKISFNPNDDYPSTLRIQNQFWTMLNYYCQPRTLRYIPIEHPSFQQMKPYYWFYPTQFQPESCYPHTDCSEFLDTIAVYSYSQGSGILQYWIMYNSSVTDESYVMGYYEPYQPSLNQDFFVIDVYQTIIAALADAGHAVWCFISDPSLCQ